MWKSGDDDEDDLEALRLNALATLKAKKPPPMMAPRPPPTYYAQPRPRPNNIFHRHQNNSNLIAIVPISDDCVAPMKPVPSLKTVPVAPVLVLPQDRYCKPDVKPVAAQEDDTKVTTKFNRYDKSSSSEDSDQSESDVEASEDDDPDVLLVDDEDENSLDLLMSQLDDEINQTETKSSTPAITESPKREGPSVRHPDSPPSRRLSPPRRVASPVRRQNSPARRLNSPPRRLNSPGRRVSPPRRLGSPIRRLNSPLRRPSSPPRRQISPPRRLTPPRRRSLSRPRSPRRRSRSPLRNRSPVRARSPFRLRSPIRARSRSPVRTRSPLRGRSRSRSPVRVRSRSPIRARSRSPIRARSRSPVRARIGSPIRGRIGSPIRPRSRSPVRVRSRSPVRARIGSPIRGRIGSPICPRSRSPVRARSRSPIRARSRSPIRARSRSPIRGRIGSPVRARNGSPARGRSRSPDSRNLSPNRQRQRRGGNVASPARRNAGSPWRAAHRPSPAARDAVSLSPEAPRDRARKEPLRPPPGGRGHAPRANGKPGKKRAADKVEVWSDESEDGEGRFDKKAASAESRVGVPSFTGLLEAKIASKPTKIKPLLTKQQVSNIRERSRNAATVTPPTKPTWKPVTNEVTVRPAASGDKPPRLLLAADKPIRLGSAVDKRSHNDLEPANQVAAGDQPANDKPAGEESTNGANSTESDLRTELKRRRAERMSKLGPASTEPGSRLVQSAILDLVGKKQKKRLQAKREARSEERRVIVINRDGDKKPTATGDSETKAADKPTIHSRLGKPIGKKIKLKRSKQEV